MSLWEVCKIAIGIAVVAGTVFYFTKSVKRLFQVAGGIAILESVNALYDLGLWPLIQGLYGGLGAAALIIGVFIMNFVMLKCYQKSKTDWLGIAVVDDVLKKSVEIKQNYIVSKGWKKLWLALPALISCITEKVVTIRLIPFLVLSVIQDSFVATAFHLQRKNGKVNVVLERDDYVVFILSTVFSCFVWTFFTEYITIPAFTNVWHTFLG